MKYSITEHIRLVQEIDLVKLEEIANLIRKKISHGKKILIFGNGGSAADAQHFAAELIGRFKKERRAIPAIALTTDTSIITAIGNDYGFDQIFKRQLEGILSEGDVVIAISTSGNSLNVVNAIDYAIDIADTAVIALTGCVPNRSQTLADHFISVNSISVARIQEIHELILHIIAEKIEE